MHSNGSHLHPCLFQNTPRAFNSGMRGLVNTKAEDNEKQINFPCENINVKVYVQQDRRFHVVFVCFS